MKFNSLICSLLISNSLTLFACPDSMSEMKKKQEAGGWTVIWSESYGHADLAGLVACAYLGCATEYLGQRLSSLAHKVGKSTVEKAIKNPGVIKRSGDYEIEYGKAFWGESIKKFGECLTTAKYVRLYAKYRKISDRVYRDGELPTQGCWKWNPNNQELYYGCNGVDHGSSLEYELHYIPNGAKYNGAGQQCWKWNPKTQGLYYGCNPKSPDHGDSYNYVLYHGPNAPGFLGKNQSGWKWNPGNQNLYYGENGVDHGSSYNYFVKHK